jgi:hypothetical protein
VTRRHTARERVHAPINPTQRFDRRPRELFPGLPRVHALQPTDAAIAAAAEERNKAAS